MDWLFILNEQPQLIELSYTANRGISRKGKKCKTVFKDFPAGGRTFLKALLIILYIDTEPSSKTMYRFQKNFSYTRFTFLEIWI